MLHDLHMFAECDLYDLRDLDRIYLMGSVWPRHICLGWDLWDLCDQYDLRDLDRIYLTGFAWPRYFTHVCLGWDLCDLQNFYAEYMFAWVRSAWSAHVRSVGSVWSAWSAHLPPGGICMICKICYLPVGEFVTYDTWYVYFEVYTSSRNIYGVVPYIVNISYVRIKIRNIRVWYMIFYIYE